MMMKYNENGRSMVEMLGVLAIIGVLSVGGIAGYSKAMNKYKINKTTDQVSMLVANIRTLFSSQGNYGDLDNAEAIKFGVVPNDMIKTKKETTPGAKPGDKPTTTTTTSLANAFGGAVTIAADKARDGDASSNEAFTIRYDGLSSEACVTVSTGDWGSGQASGLIAIGAGETGTLTTAMMTALMTDGGTPAAAAKVVTAQPGVKASPTPISVSNAVTACDGAQNSGSGYSVMWKYY